MTDRGVEHSKTGNWIQFLPQYKAVIEVCAETIYFFDLGTCYMIRFSLQNHIDPYTNSTLLYMCTDIHRQTHKYTCIHTNMHTYIKYFILNVSCVCFLVVVVVNRVEKFELIFCFVEVDKFTKETGMIGVEGIVGDLKATTRTSWRQNRWTLRSPWEDNDGNIVLR